MSDLELRLRTGAPPGWPDASPEGLDVFHQPTWRECALPDPDPLPTDSGTILVVGHGGDSGPPRWIADLHPGARIVPAHGSQPDFAAVVAAAMPLSEIGRAHV